MLVLALAGCAVRPPVPDVPADPSLPSRCERAFAGLDAAIERAGVRDAEATPVAGFPALRLTRFLASFADPAMDDPTFRSWYARLADEGRKARLVEIANLPPPQTQDALEALRAKVSRRCPRRPSSPAAHRPSRSAMLQIPYVVDGSSPRASPTITTTPRARSGCIR